MLNRKVTNPLLWQQLLATAQVLQAVRQGQSGTAALDAVLPELRSGVQALSFSVWRSLARAEALRRLLAPRNPPAAVDALLCVALALCWQSTQTTYDAFTLVNQSVEAAKRSRAMQAKASFVNACLRRFLRERDHWVALTDADPVALWNHPAWWIRQLQADWPQHWQSLLHSANQAGPMVLRVNLRRVSQDDFLSQLQQLGLAGVAAGACGVVLETPCPVQKLPGFDAGWVSVQDSAAQLAAPLLLSALSPHLTRPRILDACAAPGGKTGHLLEMSDAHVTALEVDAHRCERLNQSLQRLGLQADVKVADASQPELWWDGQGFDAILLDAPCSASGIVRRHPDIRWLRRPGDLPRLAATQAHLLQRLWPLLKPGGALLYCTCSVFQCEGAHQIEQFCATQDNARVLPAPGHLLPSSNITGLTPVDNRLHDPDGFFYALLQKSPA